MRLNQGCSGMWIVPIAVLLDRGTKVAVAHDLLPSSLIPNLINVRKVSNTGMAFSLFSENTIVLSVLTFLLIAGLTCWLIARPKKQSRLLRVGLWMVVAGGLGNLYDRLAYGYVIDFIELAFVRFAIFNLADVFICIGIALAAIALIRDERKKELEHVRTNL